MNKHFADQLDDIGHQDNTMTNDDEELLGRLEFPFLTVTPDGTFLSISAKKDMEQAAARIRELKAERDEAVTQMLEAKLANKGIAEGTQVIMPVAPTIKLLKAIADEIRWHDRDDICADPHEVSFDAYEAMIRAAQEGDDG